jgi:DegV family protein with EDD domain
MIRIVADTLSCIPPQEARALGIAYLPQIVIFGEESFRDDYEITSNEFLSKLTSTKALPKTSAPSPELYHPIYETAIEQDDELIIVLPSQTMSGTFRSATTAALDYPELKAHFFDAEVLAPALGSMVRNALRYSKEGKTAEEILAELAKMRNSCVTYFVVDTLEFLHRGGRIGAAKALFGSVLQIKPILGLENASIIPIESQRTTRKATQRLIQLVSEQYPKQAEGFLTLCHAGADERINHIAQQLQEMLNIEKIPIYNLPPAIMTHAGPGTVCAQFFTLKFTHRRRERC